MSVVVDCDPQGYWNHSNWCRRRHERMMAIGQTLVPDALDDEQGRKSVVVKQAGHYCPQSVRPCHML